MHAMMTPPIMGETGGWRTRGSALFLEKIHAVEEQESRYNIRRRLLIGS
jgi:hypothetical protein